MSYHQLSPPVVRVHILLDGLGQITHIIEDTLPYYLPNSAEIILIRQQPPAPLWQPGGVSGGPWQGTSIQDDIKDFNAILRSYFDPNSRHRARDSQITPRSMVNGDDCIPWQGIIDYDTTLSATGQLETRPAAFVRVPRPISSNSPPRYETFYPFSPPMASASIPSPVTPFPFSQPVASDPTPFSFAPSQQFTSSSSRSSSPSQSSSPPRHFSSFSHRSPFESFSPQPSSSFHPVLKTPEKPFTCEFCSFKSSTLRGISIHENKAHRPAVDDSRPPTCPQCFKIFTSRGRLNLHMIVHSTAKPYACPYAPCPRAYKRSGTLGVHIRARHQPVGPRVWCSICWKDFCERDYQRKHVRKQHVIPAIRQSYLLLHLLERRNKWALDMMVARVANDMGADPRFRLIENNKALVRFLIQIYDKLFLQQQPTIEVHS